MYCSECGAKLVDGANFCTKCGNPVELIEAPASEGEVAAKRATAPATTFSPTGDNLTTEATAEKESAVSEGPSAVAADQAEPASGTDSEPATAQAAGAPAASSGANLKAAGKGSLAKRLRKLPVIVLVAIAIAAASAVAYAAYWTYTTFFAPQIEQSQQAEQPQSTEDTAAEPAANKKKPAESAAEKANKKAHKSYQGIVSNYRKAIKDSNYDQNKNKYDVNAVMFADLLDSCKKVQYAYIDLNGDGVDELLLGCPEPSFDESVGTGSDYIVDAYSFADGTAKRIVTGSWRMRLRLVEGRRFVYYSEGTMVTWRYDLVALRSAKDVEKALRGDLLIVSTPANELFKKAGVSYGHDADEESEVYTATRQGASAQSKKITKKEFEKGLASYPKTDASVKWKKVVK